MAHQEVRLVDSLTGHLLATGARTELPWRQYKVLFQFLHSPQLQPLRQDHLTRFPSGLVRLAPFR